MSVRREFEHSGAYRFKRSIHRRIARARHSPEGYRRTLKRCSGRRSRKVESTTQLAAHPIKNSVINTSRSKQRRVHSSTDIALHLPEHLSFGSSHAPHTFSLATF